MRERPYGWRRRRGARRCSATRWGWRRSWTWPRTASESRASPRPSDRSRAPAWSCAPSSEVRTSKVRRHHHPDGRRALFGGGVGGPLRVGDQRFRYRVVDAEDLAEPGNAKDPEDAALGADQVDPAIVRPDALEAADKHAKSGRVEELDRLHIHDQVVAAGIDERDQPFPQLGRGVDVDLAADRDDGGPRSVGVHVEREIHAS